MKNHIEITNFNDPNLDLYARLSEVQLLRYAEPKQGIFVAESPKVIGRALQAGYEPISFLMAHQDLDREAVEILEQWEDIPVYTAEDSVEIDDPELKRQEKLAIILGTEGEGLLAETMKACDYTVKIPMSHGVDSLNVAAASAVAFWELGR